ncbi:hypothetical protein TREMEDRAFT_31545 [Tremella mesenterica DSM 1558]|uniref:uncharacterized protein n=1 Tax=Tremella mesenterica (strain ATCC 24925 / CBS 8224 / DSM 1558 / NBRC 9311 / NRRL Y-6157 / RJB 2259-6 / UBC 559-6) TaxID=578456 RepID=UPI0003F4A5E0|nr:uncharacterized protein TREMEDRAFT_31545 [Tremella mesenterica DSM 1558]EIW69163.1 hypothetical protein TREMEDRAFT_31545 [Tremella mesenterica DSM 1558]
MTDLQLDPAIERWNYMRENVYQTFKFTRRATRHIFILAGLAPASIALIAWSNDAKYDWAGKLRGSSLLSKPPAKE